MSNSSKAPSVFPAVELADEDGLLCVGGELCPELLLLAYKSGIFPWPLFEDAPITWFAPPTRALLFVEDFHLSRSTLKEAKKRGYRYARNESFREVIESCAISENRKGQQGTWINREMVDAYTELHSLGYCHSFECYEGEELIGGVYGIEIGKMFAGESMFYKKSNASKLCLWHLIEYLREKKIGWLDCQVISPFLVSIGAVEVERKVFMELLDRSLSGGAWE